MNLIKSEKEIKAMRASGAMLAQVLASVCGQAVAGATTRDLDRLAITELKRLGGKPAFLGYQGFPAGLCASVNDEVVHGIPSDRELAQGDIVGLDFGVRYRGMITDAARSVIVGKADRSAVTNLLKATEESLSAGIEAVRAGAHVGDIGAAVSARLARDNLGIVTDLVGHGVGHTVHEPPEIPNVSPPGQGPVLKAGMTIAIEPMATLGGPAVTLAADGWTIKTADGSASAHFEHTVLVTEDGYEILTSPSS